MKDITDSIKKYDEAWRELRDLLIECVEDFITKYGKKTESAITISIDSDCGQIESLPCASFWDRHSEASYYDTIQSMVLDLNDRTIDVSSEFNSSEIRFINIDELNELYDCLVNFEDSIQKNIFIVTDGTIKLTEE